MPWAQASSTRFIVSTLKLPGGVSRLDHKHAARPMIFPEFIMGANQRVFMISKDQKLCVSPSVLQLSSSPGTGNSGIF